MKFKLIILISIFVFLTGCNFTINPTHGKIEIRQNNSIIDIETGVYDFGNIPVNDSSPEIEFVIENVGITKLILIGTPKIAVSGDASMFTINQSMTESTVSSESSTVFTVKFQPKSTGVKSSTISVETTDPSKNPYTFKITGNGVTPEINIMQDSTNIPNRTGVYNFGVVEKNITSAEITFTIENLGTSNLNLTGSPIFQISGTDASMFTINQTMTISRIAPNVSTTFTVSFLPTSGGLKSATISISNDDLDENPYTFKVIGTCRPYYCWTKRIGGSDYERGDSAIDNSGNIYITGSFDETVDFGSDFGVSDSITSYGGYDIFITKINANGTYGWTKRMGGISYDIPFSITTDTSDNIYITGSFIGYVNFGEDFGVPGPQTSAGWDDVFVTKINSNSTYGWTKRFGGIGNDTGNSVATDHTGNIYITGCFRDTVDFGADFGVSDIKKSVGDLDSFVTKINANGSYGWTRKMGGTNWDNGQSILVESSVCVYVIGFFRSTVDFGADFGVSDIKYITGDDQDIFITKINANGTYGWTKTIASSRVNTRNSITADSSGNIYIVGVFINTVDFGLDFGASDIKTSSKYHGDYYRDVFVTKINANGTYGWTKKMERSYVFQGNTITTDSSDNIYVTGYFGGSVDFGADFGVSDIKTSSYDSSDVFITKLNANGSYGWTKRIGGLGNECGASVTTDSSGNIYVTGEFDGTTDFGEDFGVSDVKTSLGFTDIFITKICP